MEDEQVTGRMVRTGRASWFQTQETVLGVTSAAATNELGLTLNGTVPLARWLALRGTILLRGGIDEGQASIPWGTAASLFLVGSY